MRQVVGSCEAPFPREMIWCAPYTRQRESLPASPIRCKTAVRALPLRACTPGLTQARGVAHGVGSKPLA
jgi:hypothetical protein